MQKLVDAPILSSSSSSSTPSVLEHSVAFIKASIAPLLEEDKDWQEYVLITQDSGVVEQAKADRIEKRWRSFRATMENICIETKTLCAGEWASDHDHLHSSLATAPTASCSAPSRQLGMSLTPAIGM